MLSSGARCLIAPPVHAVQRPSLEPQTPLRARRREAPITAAEVAFVGSKRLLDRTLLHNLCSPPIVFAAMLCAEAFEFLT
jgi:hypothetical protein